MKVRADEIDGLFGTIAPPITSIPVDPQDAVAGLIGLGIKLFMFTAGILMLLYLMWGALDWVISSGDKEKLAKAQQKIMNAVIGIVVLIFVLVVFRLLTVDILHIFEDEGFFQFTIPSISD